ARAGDRYRRPAAGRTAEDHRIFRRRDDGDAAAGSRRRLHHGADGPRNRRSHASPGTGADRSGRLDQALASRQRRRSLPGLFMEMTAADARRETPYAHLVTCIALLWIAGVGLRVTILAVPPLIRLIHDELGLSETQVGILSGLPTA